MVVDIRKIKQVNTKNYKVVLNVQGHSITLSKNKRTERITPGQRVILLYSDLDGRPVACIYGWRLYFLAAPLRFDAHQVSTKPRANQFAGIRKRSLDRAVYRLFRLPQKIMSKRR